MDGFQTAPVSAEPGRNTRQVVLASSAVLPLSSVGHCTFGHSIALSPPQSEPTGATGRFLCTGDTPAANGHSQAWKAATSSSSFPHSVSPQLSLGTFWSELLQSTGGCSQGQDTGLGCSVSASKARGRALGRDKEKGKFGCSPNEV